MANTAIISPFNGLYRISQCRTATHGGLDLVADGNDKTVYSVSAGTVTFAGYDTSRPDGGFGYYVRVELSDGTRMYYGHMQKDSLKVSTGDTVYKGQPLGVQGNTGFSTGYHLHIEWRVAGTSKESLPIEEFLGIDNTLYNQIEGIIRTGDEPTPSPSPYLNPLDDESKQWIADNPDAIYRIRTISTWAWDNQQNLIDMPYYLRQYIADHPDAIYYFTTILTWIWDNQRSL